MKDDSLFQCRCPKKSLNIKKKIIKLTTRTANHNKAADEVRSYLSDLTGFRSIKVIHRDENFGLAESIIQGVTEVLQRSEKVIVLEDDMVVSP